MSSKKKAFITGITGQDGSYLAELLLEYGYEVHGLIRRTSVVNTDRIEHLGIDPHHPDAKLHLHYGDLTDDTSLIRIIQEIQPDEIYNLAGMSHVQISFENPVYTSNVNALGTVRLLEAIRILKMESRVKFYQASTSELFGKVVEEPQTETTAFHPVSPYGVAKFYSYWFIKHYREAYNMFVCNGIMFNHESPRRGENFVTRKITRAVAAIALGKEKKFYIGNLNVQRDWGHAKDYVEAMYLMLQQEKPDDFVIATGRSVNLRDFIKMAFDCVGIKVEFEGQDLDEYGYIAEIDYGKFQQQTGQDGNFLKNKQVIVETNSKYYRPTEADVLKGDASKVKKILGWEPKYNLEKLVEEMVKYDLKLVMHEEKHL